MLHLITRHRPAPLVLAIALFGAPAAAQLFRPPVAFYAPHARGLVVGDINGNHKVDIAVSSSPDNSVFVLGADGNGGFLPPRQFAVGSQPQFLAAADLNNDGRLDLFTPNAGTGSLSVLRNIGGAALFAPAQQFPAGSFATCAAAGDLNRDGKQDVVIANFGGNSLTILLGNGNGGFVSTATWPLASNPDHLAIADFDRDGYLDVVVTQRYLNTVVVLIGNGFGWFTAARTSQVGGGNPGYLVPADFDGDGLLDLVVTSYKSSGFVNVLRGLGRGVFRQSATVSAGVYTYAIAVGDVDADGRLDVIAADGLAGHRNVYFLRGDGAAHLSSPLPIALPAEPTMLALVDCNSNGRLDLVCTSYWADSVQVLFDQ